jgi:hypothetical protein
LPFRLPGDESRPARLLRLQVGRAHRPAPIILFSFFFNSASGTAVNLVTFVLQPWQLLLAILAGWVNQQQQDVIEYLPTEKQILKEKLGKRRILLNDDQRRRLAVKGKILGRKMLEAIGTLVTSDTILASPARCQEVGFQRLTQTRQTDRRRRDQAVGRADGTRKSNLGL